MLSLHYMNALFTGLFTMETFLKLHAFGPRVRDRPGLASADSSSSISHLASCTPSYCTLIALRDISPWTLLVLHPGVLHFRLKHPDRPQLLVFTHRKRASETLCSSERLLICMNLSCSHYLSVYVEGHWVQLTGGFLAIKNNYHSY